jgi:hypothetical protein
VIASASAAFVTQTLRLMRGAVALLGDARLHHQRPDRADPEHDGRVAEEAVEELALGRLRVVLGDRPGGHVAHAAAVEVTRRRVVHCVAVAPARERVVDDQRQH